MRTFTPTGPTSAATDFTACSDAASSNTMALSALRVTREAIARWTGTTESTTAPRRDVAHVSPQARWLAKTQQDLAAWLESGGFSQVGATENPQRLPALPGPIMYDIGACRVAGGHDRQVDAFAD